MKELFVPYREILYNITEVWNYMSTNAKELNKLDKDSIEL